MAFVVIGIAAYQVERNRVFGGIDGGLQARANRLTGILFQTEVPQTTPEKVGEIPGALRGPLREGAENRVLNYYQVFAAADGALLFEGGVPPDAFTKLSLSGEMPRQGVVRMRDGWRERILFVRRDFLLAVGREVSDELAALRKYATQLILGGSGVLVVCMLASALLSKRALKPIADISQAATRIADGALYERVETGDKRSELGELAKVLNHTFDQLESAYRRQAQFTADASHELRTPISVILSETQSGPETEAELKESLSVCEESARSMRRLVEQLLELARFDAGTANPDFKQVDLRELTGSCIDRISSLASARGIEISRDLSNTSCQGDADRLGQVLTNLLSNAIAYNRENGTILVELRERDGFTEIAICDSGPGIAAEDLPHLFERFYRADKARSSDGHSGLGLAICKEIAETHGGEVTAESELGKGSVFTLRLPI
ncbi:MAG: ATP-binding protein [Verrucomicrobiota bacterium]